MLAPESERKVSKLNIIYRSLHTCIVVDKNLIYTEIFFEQTFGLVRYIKKTYQHLINVKAKMNVHAALFSL